MTEDEARDWLQESLGVPRETLGTLAQFVEFLRSESGLQNLVSRTTLANVWTRHIVDSAQLLTHAPGRGSWVDLGSGAGFPGLIVGTLRTEPVTLIELRRKRIDFLDRAVKLLGIESRVEVVGTRAETMPAKEHAVISARAFAPLDKLFAIGARFAGPNTIWVLPKGQSAQAELDAVCRTWQGVFRIEPSVTEPASSILIAEQVRPREQR